MTEIRVQIPRLHDGQREIRNAAKRFNVLECGRRFGKTTLGEVLAMESAIAGDPVGWFSPTYKLLADVWRDVVRMMQPITAVGGVNVQEKRLELITGGVIDFWSLDGVDSGRGRKYKRAIIDEGGIVRDLQENWNAAIRPTLTDYKGDAWFLGTPKGRNFFHQLFTRGESDEPGWASWRRGTIHNPRIDPEEIEAARRELPESVFNQEYLGIPADDGGNPFGLDAIRKCIKPLSTLPPVVYGVDLAKSVDWTVVIGLDANGDVSRYERWQGPWDATTARVKAICGDTFTVVDSTGVGDPILEGLQKGGGQFVGFKFSAPSKQQIMEGLAAAIHQQAIGFPEGAIVSELSSFEYEYTRTGVHYCLAPETRVLTSDLRWVPVGGVGGGDTLLAFDEHKQGGSKLREWKLSTVQSTGRAKLPCYRTTFNDGTVVVSSESHMWLVDDGQGEGQWRTTAQLRAPHPASRSQRFAPSRVVRLLQPWEYERDFETGYIAAALDGEGCITQGRRHEREKGSTFRIAFAQRENAMASTMRQALKAKGFEYTEHKGGGTNGDVISFAFNGRITGKLRLLGQIRPQRLLDKFDPAKLGGIYAMPSVHVVEHEAIGIHEVVTIGTSTKTLIAEGLASHNSAPQGLHDDTVCALALARYAQGERAKHVASFRRLAL